MKVTEVHNRRKTNYSIYVSRPRRVGRYGNGIEEFLEFIGKGYGLQHAYSLSKDIDLSLRNTIAIDIGSNIGEFALSLIKKFEFPGKCFCFEPDPTEFVALALNAQTVKNIFPINAALSNCAGKSWLYLQNQTGDTTLLPHAGFKKRMITTYSLDDYLESNSLAEEEIWIIKIEAEGLEPEVIEGSYQTLRRTRFVAADLGPERYGEQTLIDSEKMLKSLNFRRVFTSPSGHRHLFMRD